MFEINDKFKTKECKKCGLFYAGKKCPCCERIKKLKYEKDYFVTII